MKKEKHTYEESYVHRLKWFNDGVIAIIITILILNINIWDYQSNINTQTFVQKLNEVWPNILSYIISFYVVWKFWFSNFKLFECLKSVDVKFVVFNFVFLFALSLIPFGTSLMWDYYYINLAIFIYLFFLIFASIASISMRFYVYKTQNLLKKNIDRSSVYIWFSLPLAAIITMIVLSISWINFLNHYLLYIFPLLIFIIKKLFSILIPKI